MNPWSLIISLNTNSYPIKRKNAEPLDSALTHNSSYEIQPISKGR